MDTTVPTTSQDEPSPQLLGYAAFRTPRGTIALTHLAVSPTARNRGVARRLVNELRRQHPDLRGISARCRRDYEANTVWPRLGFVAQGDRKGRSADGHLLTDWWLDFGQPDLLTWEGGTQTTTPVVIDTNIFLALHGRGADTRVAQAIEAVAGRLQILVTPELKNELNRNPDDKERRRLIQIAQGYPQLPVAASTADEKESLLLKQLPQPPASIQDVSDARHVAYAMAAGIEIVVTQDRNAKSRLGDAARDFGVAITNPFELIVRLDQYEDQPSYSPQALKSTGYTLTEAGSDDPDLKEFINTARGERRSRYAAVCNELAAGRPQSHRLLLRDPLGEPIGLIGSTSSPATLTVSLLRIRNCALPSSVAAQLVGHLRVLADDQSAEVIVVRDAALDSSLFEALLEDGYHSAPSGMIAVTIRAALTSQQLRERWSQIKAALPAPEQDALAAVDEVVQQPHTSRVAYQLEHQLRPLRLLDCDLDTWVLSIKPGFATDLFGYPPQLFDRPSDIGIQREHVYFRGAKSGEKAPGRILWYATDPQKEIFAISSLMEVRDMAPRSAHTKYRRLGVYDLEQLRDAARIRGTVRCLRVTDTEVLRIPIPLTRLREIEGKTGRTLQLVSANKIDATWFTDLMVEAFDRG
ncbi:GNAT family N-acetyltransferase [Mycobacteroides abscessus]|uniref:GNAT family N-acetyltransferase n=1 Tax=Mycobacteroides abscessus TaxID=36809 RepID=UPI0013F5D75D|nr:GNAT family N-acetyltransferase [Mycobacteroides abscessus]